MASTVSFRDYIAEQLPERGVMMRPMMGEYVLYYKDKVVGGIYDDRLLVKVTPSAKKLLPDAPLELPYEGGKDMLLVDNSEDKDFLENLLEALFSDLPAPKKKK